MNVESNNISPQTIAKIFEAINVHQAVINFKGANQQAQFLGNKVETSITRAIEANKVILKVGLHFQFGDCRNRVAVQLQKNLDRLRLKLYINLFITKFIYIYLLRKDLPFK